MGTHWNCLIKAILLNTHNRCFFVKKEENFFWIPSDQALCQTADILLIYTLSRVLVLHIYNAEKQADIPCSN